MQNRSQIPTTWGKVGLSILPGLFALSASWTIEAKDMIPTLGLALCVLLSIFDLVRERRVSPWTFSTWGVLFGLLIRPIWLLLGFLALLAVFVALICLLRHKPPINVPRLVWILPCVMALLGMVIPFHFGPWVLAGSGATLLVIAIGLLLARHSGLSAGIFVAAAGFRLWEEIFDLTYGLWKTPWCIVMVATLALLLLVVSPTWVLRSRSSRAQVWGLLLPTAIALTGVAVINAVARTAPSILEQIVDFRAIFPSAQFIYGISEGSRGRENLVLLLFQNSLTAAQLFAGMALAVVLYRWIERRNRAAGNVQQNVIPLRQGATG